jgi:hypothetical protein
MIHTRAEGHGLPMVAPAAILRCVGGIDFDTCSASFFRFARQSVKKSSPRGILNAFGETMVMGQTVDMKVFDTDHTETIDDLPTFLVGEGITPEGDTLVNTSNNLAVFASLRRTFRQLGVLTLYFGQGLFLFAEKAGVRDLFSIGEGRKGFESDVNTDLGRRFWQTFRFALTGERDVPLSGTTPTDGTGFDLTLDRTVIDHLDTANLGEGHTVIMRETEATLREGEAIIAVTASEARKTRIFTSFAASKERFEGQVNTDGDILQDLGVDTFKRGAFLFQERIGRLLLIARETFSCVLVGMLALLQQVVIQPTTLIKGFVECVNLLLGGIDAILKHFTHVHILFLICSVVKFSLRGRAAGFSSPCLKSGAFKPG